MIKYIVVLKFRNTKILYNNSAQFEAHVKAAPSIPIITIELAVKIFVLCLNTCLQKLY